MPIHVVAEGETLWDISKRYETDISMIMKVNGLESGKLVEGLALFIPDGGLVERSYLVKKNDSLETAANRFGESLSALVKNNPSLMAGDFIEGRRITILVSQKQQLQTLAFAFPGGEEITEALEEHADELSYIAIVAYSFTEQGEVYEEGNPETLVEQAKKSGVTPFLMVRNYRNGDFDAELAETVLGDGTLRNRLAESLAEMAEEKGYSGVSVDLEFVPPDQRKNFGLFLKQLKKQLNKKILHVNVHAKTEDDAKNRITGGQDYKEIGETADLVALMTIDYGYPGGPSEPIAPLWWMAEVIRYAISAIPSSKLQAAIALYGYDKTEPENKTTAVSAEKAQNKAIQMESPIKFDEAAASPGYTYTEEATRHSVWFEDIRSVKAKYSLLDAYSFAGATFWHLGLKFPQNWAYIQETITVKK